MPSTSEDRYNSFPSYQCDLRRVSGGTTVGPSTSGDPVIRSDRLRYATTSKEWGRTPGYKSLTSTQKKHLAPTHLELRKSFISGSFSGASSWQLGGWNDFEGFSWSRKVWDLHIAYLNWGPLYLAGSDLITDSDLFLNARLQLKDRRSWSAPIFLAELHKSSSMIYTSAEKIVSGLRAARRLDVRSLNKLFGPSRSKKLGSKPAALWLQYKYGWMPLVQDVRGAASAISDLSQRWASPDSQSNVHVRLFRSRSEAMSYQLQGSPDIVGHGERIEKCSSRLNCRFYVNDRPLYTSASLGILNPLEVVWELVPFSFVADWFAPIGSMISSLDAGIGVTITSCWKSQRQEVFESINSASSATFNEYASARADRYSLRVSRDEVAGGLPQAIPSQLSIQPKLGAERLTSAIALMRQLTR